MAVIARRLVRAQGHVAPCLLEHYAGTDDSIDDADGARIYDHRGPALGDQGGLLVAAVGEMHCNQGLIQVSQGIQKLRRPLAVTLDDLICLTVPLLYVHVDLGASLFYGLLDLQKHFWTDKIGALGAKENFDAAVCFPVPGVVESQVAVQALFAHVVVKLIELTGLVDPALGGADGLSDVAAGAYFLNKSAHIFHFGLIVP